MKFFLKNFMIYIIHKMLALLKSNLNYLKDSIFECHFIEFNRLPFFKKKAFLFITYNNGKFISSGRKHN